MPRIDDLERLHSAISDLVKLYQFRNRDEKLYSGVTVAQAYCLRALWLRGPLSMGELAREVTVPVSTMTGVVDQLVARRLVIRRTAPEDRRSLRVELSASGRRLYDRSNAEFRQRLVEVAARYDDGELAVVREFLSDFTTMIRDWRGIDLELPEEGRAHA